jgi:hypothetical protein
MPERTLLGRAYRQAAGSNQSFFMLSTTRLRRRFGRQRAVGHWQSGDTDNNPNNKKKEKAATTPRVRSCILSFAFCFSWHVQTPALGESNP